MPRWPPSRGYTVNEDMLGSRGGFVDVFGGGARTVDRLTADLGKDWDIVDFLAIKLWPGAHPFSGTVEAAMNAARQSATSRPTRWRRSSWPGRIAPRIQGSRRPANLAEAIHSLSYYVAAAVADKDFTWAHATRGKVLGSDGSRRLMDLVDVDPAPPPVKYKWSWGGTVTIVTTSGARFTSTVDAPRGSGPARHRVERRRSQVPRAHARVEAAGSRASTTSSPGFTASKA